MEIVIALACIITNVTQCFSVQVKRIIVQATLIIQNTAALFQTGLISL